MGEIRGDYLYFENSTRQGEMRRKYYLDVNRN